MDSERKMEALRNIYSNVVAQTEAMDVARQIDYMVGTQFINGDIFEARRKFELHANFAQSKFDSFVLCLLCGYK